MELTFVPAGHILGAAQVHIRIGSQSVHFTGDLGRTDDPLMFPPRPLGEVDVLVTESTYGNRKHSTVDPEQQLGEIITRVAKRDGVVLIRRIRRRPGGDPDAVPVPPPPQARDPGHPGLPEQPHGH